LYGIGRPDGARGEECDDHDCGARQNKPIRSPNAARSGFFIEACADARQKRGGHFGVGGDVKARIDGGEEGSFLFECGAAGGASIKVRAQITLWLDIAGGGFDQRFFIMLA
jgi:hypothetical protein